MTLSLNKHKVSLKVDLFSQKQISRLTIIIFMAALICSVLYGHIDFGIEYILGDITRLSHFNNTTTHTHTHQTHTHTHTNTHTHTGLSIMKMRNVSVFSILTSHLY